MEDEGKSRCNTSWVEGEREAATIKSPREMVREGRTGYEDSAYSGAMEQHYMCSLSSLEEGLAGHLYRELAGSTTFNSGRKHTAQVPAIEATIPPEIIMGLTPRVLLKSIPLNAPAATLLEASCLPRA